MSRTVSDIERNSFGIAMICEYLPGAVATVCGTIGSFLCYLYGGLDVSIQWLLVFAIIDYITGSIASFRKGQWSSKTGGKGIVKKIIMFVFVALGYGIDQTAQTDCIKQAVIIAYMINEIGSIIENIDSLGYGNSIPPIIRRGIKLLADRQDRIMSSVRNNTNNDNQDK